MSKEKEMIRKLLKISQDQQKVITKLAQVAGIEPLATTDAPTEVGQVVEQFLSVMPEAEGYSCKECRVSPSGSVDGKLLMPAGNQNFRAVTDKLKAQLAGKTVSTPDGAKVKVTDNKFDIRFVGESL
jgi:hypothetical protein